MMQILDGQVTADLVVDSLDFRPLQRIPLDGNDTDALACFSIAVDNDIGAAIDD